MQSNSRLAYFFNGPALVMVAAALWALDALLRTQLTKTIPSAWIVVIEHFVGFIILIPIFIRAIPSFKKLENRDWLILICLTIVSSVAGTLLFTEALARSFALYDFASPVLLQKLQPVFVVFLATLFLRERLTLRYVLLVPVALIGSYLISFGDAAVSLSLSGKGLVYILAIGAAFAWGSGTILSKFILKKLSFAEATSMRFLLAVPIGLVPAFFMNSSYSLMTLQRSDVIRFIIIAFTTGAGAVLIYYKGLQNTEAKVATIAELTFPIISLIIAISILNPYGAPQVLSLANIFGIIILLCSVLAISLEREA